MKLSRVIPLAVLAVLAPAACLVAAEPGVDQLIQELKGEGAPQQRTAQDWRSVHAKALDELLRQMGSQDAKEREQAQKDYQQICWRAARPGAHVERDAACAAIVARLTPDVPKLAQLWLIRQLEHIGRDEAIGSLARLLDHQDRLIRERARRALQNNPSPRALTALRDALPRAKTPSWRVALANALGARRDAASVTVLARLLDDADLGVANAAAAALGPIGGDQAIEALDKARRDPRLHKTGHDAFLACAERLLREGRKQEAAAMYEEVYASSEPKHVRVAALQGLLAAREEKSVPLIVQVLKSHDSAMQAAATRFMRELPGAAITRALADSLPSFSPHGQALVLDALADRGDALAQPAVVAAAKSPDERVRVAALRALAKLGDASTVALLADTAARATGKPCAAARSSLRLLRGPDVEQRLIDGIKHGRVPVRIECIRSVRDRRADAAVPALLEAAEDREADVRAEALKALGVLADEASLPELVRLMVHSTNAREQQTASSAVVAVCHRVPDEDKRVLPVLAAMERADGAARVALLRVLGRVGGQKALVAVRDTLNEANPEIRDAAIRALADWPDPLAAADLLALSRHAAKPVHQVLALRAYVRLVGLGPAQACLKGYADAIAAAQRPEEKKLVLAEVGKTADLAALALARSHLGDPTLKPEAAVAMLKIAEAVSYPHRKEAEAAVQEVLQACQDKHVLERAKRAQRAIAMYDGYLTNWLVSGPYTKSGKNNQVLFGIAFAPELPDAKDVKWQPVIGDPDPRRSWKVALDKVLGPGSSRAAYLLTWVRSDKAQDAQLQFGSDDGLKAWLNGQVVLEANVNRAIGRGQDNVTARLLPGWNRLMLKVTQAGGYWAACARPRAADGGSLSGLVRLDDLRKLDAMARDLSDPSLGRGAAEAMLEVARALSQKHPAAGKRALRMLLAASKDKAVAAQAKTILDAIEKYEDYITAWQVSGPYTKAGTGGHQLFGVPLGPEADDAVEWRTVSADRSSSRLWLVDLAKVVGGQNRAAYLRTFVHCGKGQPAVIELGSDDGVIVWLNGRVVHANNRPRPVRLGEDRARVQLTKGWNDLVLKITQGGGGWGACARFRAADGSGIDGLRAQAAPPAGHTPIPLRKLPTIGEDDPYMGEYVGKFSPANGQSADADAKVLPLGGAVYRAALLTDRDAAKRIELEGMFDGDAVLLAGESDGVEWTGQLKDKRLTASSNAGRFDLAFRMRTSPTVGKKPPKEAIVLLPFSPGKAPSLSEWTNPAWKAMPDGSMQVVKGSNLTRGQFGDCQLHVEFRIPYEPHGRGQGRGNSGVYLQRRYEVQVLDSFGLVSTDRDCGALYKIAAPRQNACLPPLAWQTYDITFRAARVSAQGKVVQPAEITVLHNGVTIHERVKLPVRGNGGGRAGVQLGSLLLQDHSHPVRYRNIWLVELKDDRAH